MALPEVIESTNIYREYSTLTVSDVIQEQRLGQENYFKELQIEISEVKNLIDKTIALTEEISEIPETIYGRIKAFIKSFLDINQILINFSSSSNAEKRRAIIQGVKNWHYAAITGIAQGSDSENIKDIGNVIGILSGYKEDPSKKVIEDYNEIKEKTEGLNRDSAKILDDLRRAASTSVLQNFARDFSDKSTIDFWWSIGWLSLALVASGFFIWLLIQKISIIIPIDYNFDPDTENIIIKQTQIITLSILRILFLSFCLYVIVLLFKQFSIKSHQSVMNSHRATTLNSYNLFIDSLDKEDGDTRNAIMMEVARAIYQMGSTGHVSEKSHTEQFPSIMELTKIINPPK